MPVDPVLTRDQPLQRDEGLPQQGVLPESPVTKNPQVDHPLVQVPPRDPLVHQLEGRVGRVGRVGREGGNRTKQTEFTKSVCVDLWTEMF